MIAKLREKGDTVRVCDFDDFSIEDLDAKQVKQYEKMSGERLVDYLRWICKVNGDYVLLYVVDIEGNGYRAYYIIGKKGVGLIESEDFYCDKIPRIMINADGGTIFVK